jgi:hypothetical protein
MSVLVVRRGTMLDCGITGKAEETWNTGRNVYVAVNMPNCLIAKSSVGNCGNRTRCLGAERNVSEWKGSGGDELPNGNHVLSDHLVSVRSHRLLLNALGPVRQYNEAGEGNQEQGLLYY